MKVTGRAGTSRALLSRVGVLALTAIFILSIGCKKESEPVAVVSNSFATPELAGQAVYAAAKAGDSNAILSIFGQEAKEYLLTGDPAEDKAAFGKFVSDYDRMHRWAALEGGAQVLDIGVDSYPFPFPLVKGSDGKWSFNTESGKKEFISRRIGDNELSVIGVLNAMADAQAEYFAAPQDGSKVKQYAQRFTSTAGKHDGLYWKVAEGEAESPLGPLAARASAEGYKAGPRESPEPFHGYFYRILTQQGAKAKGGARNYIASGNMTRGFAIVAYPAEYRVSGVMTFIVNQDRIVYQSDLGADTVNAAKAMTAYDPDENWSVVE